MFYTSKQAAEKAGIFTAVQGFTREKNGNQIYHYPVLSLICDMRKMNEIYDIIQKYKIWCLQHNVDPLPDNKISGKYITYIKNLISGNGSTLC